jgi:hypothetical protein
VLLDRGLLKLVRPLHALRLQIPATTHHMVVKRPVAAFCWSAPDKPYPRDSGRRVSHIAAFWTASLMWSSSRFSLPLSFLSLTVCGAGHHVWAARA